MTKKFISVLSLLFITINCYAFEWEKIEKHEQWRNFQDIERLYVPQGWLIKSHVYCGWSVTFVPDFKHEWKI